MNVTIENVLKQQEFWGKLTEEQQKTVLKESRVVSYEAGEIVYSGARECLGGLLVLKGSLRTYLLSDEGKGSHDLSFAGRRYLFFSSLLYSFRNYL